MDEKISRDELRDAISEVLEEGEEYLNAESLFNLAVAMRDMPPVELLMTQAELEAALAMKPLDLSRDPGDLANALMDRIRGVVRNPGDEDKKSLLSEMLRRRMEEITGAKRET